MANKMVFEDGKGNELSCRLNEALLVEIEVGAMSTEDGLGTGYITLDRLDVKMLIDILQRAKEVMDAEADGLPSHTGSAY